MMGGGNLRIESTAQESPDRETWKWDEMILVVFVDMQDSVPSLLDIEVARECHFHSRVAFTLVDNVKLSTLLDRHSRTYPNPIDVIIHITCCDRRMMTESVSLMH